MCQNDIELAGRPGILHYTQNEFKGDQQFWSVCEDNDGILYFGNNDGTLIFDGEEWHKVKLPNNSSIRSLASDSAGNVYAGGFNEFGLIKKDITGKYYYQSLFDTLKFSDNKIENLWDVHIVDNTIVYRSFIKLIAISGKKATQLPATSHFINSYVVNGNYFVQDIATGIYKLDLKTMQFEQYFTKQDLLGEEIISILPTDNTDSQLGISKTGKIFEINIAEKQCKLIEQLFSNEDANQVECAINVNKDIYIGTLSTGIIRIDQNGHILDNEGSLPQLQDQSVLNLYKTQQGNVWALLNNGLDCITSNSPITSIFQNASLFDVFIKDQAMYLATNQGVFYSDNFRNRIPKFKKVVGTEGQTWSIREYKGDILAGHDKGLYKIDKLNSKKIGSTSGIWKVIPVRENSDIFLAANYSGLFVVTKRNGEWVYLNEIQGFEESTRDILEADEDGTFWVCHGFKGVFRIKIDTNYERVTSVEHFTTQNGLISPYSINVAKWEDQIIFTTDNGIYTYNKTNNQFEPHAKLNSILDPTENTRTIMQHGDKTWFIQDDEAGYFLTNNHEEYEKGYFLQFKGEFNRGMECIAPLNSQQVMLGTKMGLYLFDLTYKERVAPAQTIITGAQYMSATESEHLPLDGETITLPNNTNSIRFDFAVPDMQNDVDIQYSYQLENMDEEWSTWQSDSYKEYSHLRPGTYTFKVRSRSLVGTQGEETSISFKLLPLWYQTKWAVILYFLVAFLITIAVIKIVKARIIKEREKAREEEQKAKKLLELELEQLKLKAEKDKIKRDKVLLEEDVILKSKELANYTMMLVKKKEIFSEIQGDIKELRGQVKTEGSRKKLQNMYSKLNKHLIGEEYMQVFESNFEKVHHDFFNKLKAEYPQLTQRELRVCAFIKMNLTNKEISPLLNISVRGVETARYRIRKKMNLEHEHNFTEFLEGLTEKSKR
ncbi:triple tyrosine motif-containing protein [Fulvivirga ligni]|uniref:triple tyrosine motif-containing protein n=1 Tax=Fulvivirga ligni TaxID=2904246 RepID=UPI001F17C445|nr:triple tyrosine motif-containing protein [Fulvivirga ligni]UII20652.1 LuxR C-terminal-related transcriptional regulator [Fulvivirga ligni]